MEYTQTGVNRALKDIRPRAEERARRRQEEAQRPPGTGFMSERTRAKEALRVEVNTYTGENVRKIAATAAAAEEDRILRVAAYCRVSTDDIDQLVSIEMQKNAYRDMIKANPKWKHVGTYVDDGFSGTNTEHRPAFQLMMKDAMAGKIDMIITKSVSRFARNLLDYIGTLQEELVRAGVLPEDYDFEAHKQLVGMQPGDVPVTYADSTALERDFGFTPKIGIREGLRAFAEWYRAFYQGK